jgi:glycosyltransferase involved in cell wall biosynthesis
LVDSPSQRDFLLAEGVLDGGHAGVLADGSVCGVDGERFRPDANARALVRSELGVPDTAVLLLYLGRLNRDKGIADLAAAFVSLASRHPDLWLLLVGPDEEEMQARVRTACSAWLDRVRFVGFTDQPVRFMAAADVFCLPSYREGFGSSVIEAAACGVPAVASRIYGLTDAVREGETGLLHPPGDTATLATQIERLVGDASLRRDMGGAARIRVLRDFSQARLTGALRNFYANVLGT